MFKLYVFFFCKVEDWCSLSLYILSLLFLKKFSCTNNILFYMLVEFNREKNIFDVGIFMQNLWM
jgi:hypothetical protein